MASPQPNGDRLSQDPVKQYKKVYWTDDKDAQKAFGKYEEKRFGKAKDKAAPEDAAKDDEFIKKNLILREIHQPGNRPNDG